MSFVHLHTHTEYSLLDGANKIKNYVARVKELGMNAAAITDHGVMTGVIYFYKACLEAGIKPIIGCEVYVAPGSRFDREVSKGDDRYYHLVLLAENNTGLANLTKIVSIGHKEGYYYKPRVDRETLEKYHEGIIALSACLAGELPRTIMTGDLQKAEEVIRDHLKIFGEGNYFLELQDHGIAEQATVNAALMGLSDKTGVPLVCTNDNHYTYAEDAEPHDLLLCLQTGKKVTDTDRMRYVGGQYYVKSEDEMRGLFPYALESLENTQKIADRCNVEIKFHEANLPNYEVPEGYDTWTYLNELCEKGLAERYPDPDMPSGNPGRSIRQQLEYELGVIKKMGYVEYFLIVWDFINYAKEHGIWVGPGRGSAAGSIVSYVLRITDIDPIKYSLIFERFLNPERVSMPDIDIDFDARRDEVIEYVMRKYGPEKVVRIITFNTLKARGVIRDVVRVMGLPIPFGDKLAKMIPKDLGITLDQALTVNPELKALYDSDEEVKKVIDMSKRLEGLPRSAGMHAAGVVICPEEADNIIPLYHSADNVISTEYEKDTVEELGLLKMDFLGLATLDVLKLAVQYIKENRGADIDLAKIDLTDPKVYSMISAGGTEGVFQLESAGMTSFMKKLKPGNLEEIIAGIALYRPGPMQYSGIYADRKNGLENVSYACPELAPILETTYGTIVYQEQVMQIARDLAGYTMGGSDELRRAMSKKKHKVMEAERPVFIKGCEERGIASKVAEGIYDEIIKFAEYAFNKAHAASYAVVTYQTAYLKAHYPIEFMAALLSSEEQKTKIAEYISVCRSMGIEVVSPDVNGGGVGFRPSGDRIIYALNAVAGVGDASVEVIVREREQNGPFKSFQDFANRTQTREINKRVVESLIKAGAFDSLGATRKQLLSIYIAVLEEGAKKAKHSQNGQISLFDILEDEEDKDFFEVPLPDCGEYEKQDLLAMEKEVLGLYISGHPLDEYKELLEKNINASAYQFYAEEEPEDDESGQLSARMQEDDDRVSDGQYVTLGGMIISKTMKYTKNNDIMCFLTLEDLTGAVECVVFPRAYAKYSNLLMEDEKVFLRGKAQTQDGRDSKLLVDDVYSFEDVASGKMGRARQFGNGNRSYSGDFYSGSGDRSGNVQTPTKIPEHGLFVQFMTQADYDEKYDKLLEVLRPSDGNDDVVIYIRETRQLRVLPAALRVKANDELRQAVAGLLGEGNAKIK